MAAECAICGWYGGGHSAACAPTRLRIAALEEHLATTTLPCGHHISLMLMSAETGEPLYCELCDLQSRRYDLEADLAQAHAKTRHAERSLSMSEADLAKMRAECERLTKDRDEWAAKWREIRKQLAELKFPGMTGTIKAVDAARKEGAK